MRKTITTLLQQFVRAFVLAAKRHYQFLLVGFGVSWLWFMNSLFVAGGGTSVWPSVAITLLFFSLSLSILVGLGVVVLGIILAIGAFLDWAQDLWESARAEGNFHE